MHLQPLYPLQRPFQTFTPPPEILEKVKLPPPPKNKSTAPLDFFLPPLFGKPTMDANPNFRALRAPHPPFSNPVYAPVDYLDLLIHLSH